MTINSRKKLACALAAVSATALASSAWAQTQPTPAAQPAPEQPAPAADNAAVADIVITAQFRSQQLQDTPIAITAVTAATLTNRGLTQIEDIQKTAPNVSLRLAGNTNGQAVQAFIRGIGQTDSNLVLEPGVGVYVDDVYQGTLFGSTFDLLDLDRVEVLRGPQGTLFGKNAIGGAIRLVSAKPNGDGSIHAELTTGSYHRLDMKAGFDVALIPDQLFLRASGFSKSRDGYVDRISFACARPAEAGKLTAPANADANCKVGTQGGENVKGGRVALRILPSAKLEINLAGDYTDNSSEAVASELVAVDPGQLAFGPLAPFNANFAIPNFGIPLDGRFVPPKHFQTYATYDNILINNGPGNPVTSTSIPPVNSVRSWGVAGTIDLELTDSIKLKSITGYRAYSGATAAIVQNAPISLGYNYNVFKHNQFSQELRLVGDSFNRTLEWALGAYYFRSTSRLQGSVSINPFALTFSQDDPSHVRDKAAFAQATFHVTDALSVTGGVRYTHETKDFLYRHNFTAAPSPQTYNEWTPHFSVDYKLTDHAMVYASYSKGFRAGGFNPRPFSPAQLTPFAPERLESYEVGFKTDWFDRHLILNGSAFYGRYTNLILNSSRPDSTGIPFLGPLNVGKADIKGFELELTAKPVGGLAINGSVGLADYKYKSLGSAVGCADPGVTAPNPGVNCVPGNPLYSSIPIGTPRWTANGGIEYAFDLGSAGSLTPRLDANYQSTIFWSNDNSARSKTPSMALLDARITYVSKDKDWSLSLGVTNLANKFYYVNYNDLIAGGLGILEGQPGRPREWSLTLRHHFR